MARIEMDFNFFKFLLCILEKSLKTDHSFVPYRKKSSHLPQCDIREEVPFVQYLRNLDQTALEFQWRCPFKQRTFGSVFRKDPVNVTIDNIVVLPRATRAGTAS